MNTPRYDNTLLKVDQTHDKNNNLVTAPCPQTHKKTSYSQANLFWWLTCSGSAYAQLSAFK